jgi:DNA mismatch repair protein MutS
VELAELAQKIAGAQAHALESELRWFAQLREAVLAHAAPILATAHALARLDVAAALAERAGEGGWVRPSLYDDQRFHIVQGRHPVVEDALQAQRQSFIANDCNLSTGQRLWLVTGPNMAGKSTFLRQNALIAILAQMGSFVPAESAHIGVVDRLFSRVGAGDDLAHGHLSAALAVGEQPLGKHQCTAAGTAGRRVVAGEHIGYNGFTGNASRRAPHVHFERKPAGGATHNPYPYLVAACR